VERRRAGECAGLQPEHLEVVVEIEDLATLAHRPLVGSDELSALEELDRLGAEQDPHLAPGETDRHRVAALADADARLRVDAVLRFETDVE
jgi:hypothetical protein